MEKYEFVEDPGHGWLAVSVEEIRSLGIADNITPYSYHDAAKGVVWLEEDCDAAVFLRAKTDGTIAAMRDWFGSNVNVRYEERTRIRNLPSFTGA
jgi:hypothetical protein